MSQCIDGVTAARLQDINRWFLREATLKAANTILVDHHHRLPLSRVWGDGTRSSSDGQRFKVERDGLLGAFYPRYFGYYERALALYTHTADQSSVYATRAISCAPREANYVLDGILENDTILKIREHTSDTGGFTEPLWGLCVLLGIDFMPRLKDLPDQVLYRVDRGADYGSLNPLLRTAIDITIIIEQWDQLVRIAASLKDRLTPAHVIMQRVINASPADRVAKALAALGRLAKTVHILRYLHEEPLRRLISSAGPAWATLGSWCAAGWWRDRGGGSARRRRRRGHRAWRSAGARPARPPAATAARRAEARGCRGAGTPA
jgi:TnpA family transposase